MGVGGLLLSVVFYFTAVSAVNGMQGAADSQLEWAGDALADSEALAASAAAGGAEVPAMMANLTAGLDSLGNATGAAGASMGGLADDLDSIPLLAGAGSALREGSGQMQAASASLKAAAASAGAATNATLRVSSQAAAIRDDVAGARASLAAARQSVDSGFGGIRNSVLLASLMFAVAFAILSAYSAAVLL